MSFTSLLFYITFLILFLIQPHQTDNEWSLTQVSANEYTLSKQDKYLDFYLYTLMENELLDYTPTVQYYTGFNRYRDITYLTTTVELTKIHDAYFLIITINEDLNLYYQVFENNAKPWLHHLDYNFSDFEQEITTLQSNVEQFTPVSQQTQFAEITYDAYAPNPNANTLSEQEYHVYSWYLEQLTTMSLHQHFKSEKLYALYLFVEATEPSEIEEITHHTYSYTDSEFIVYPIIIKDKTKDITSYSISTYEDANITLKTFLQEPKNNQSSIRELYISMMLDINNQNWKLDELSIEIKVNDLYELIPEHILLTEEIILDDNENKLYTIPYSIAPSQTSYRLLIDIIIYDKDGSVMTSIQDLVYLN